MNPWFPPVEVIVDGAVVDILAEAEVLRARKMALLRTAPMPRTVLHQINEINITLSRWAQLDPRIKT